MLYNMAVGSLRDDGCQKDSFCMIVQLCRTGEREGGEGRMNEGGMLSAMRRKSERDVPEEEENRRR